MSRNLIILIAIAAFLTLPARAANPMRVSFEMAEGVPAKATVGGKYTELLKVLHVPEDKPNYGEFKDWGYWTGTQHAAYQNLPAGHWVYVYPKWYIWRNKVK
jgi:hypothetical protein